MGRIVAMEPKEAAVCAPSSIIHGWGNMDRRVVIHLSSPLQCCLGEA